MDLRHKKSLWHKMSDAKREINDCEAPSPKKLKISDGNETKTISTDFSLKDFLPEKVLNNNTNRKTVCIKGQIKNKSGVALVILDKSAFKEDDLSETGYFSDKTEWSVYFKNDIYNNLECLPDPKLNAIKTTVIYPATEKHIAKFSQQKVYIFLESAELYKKYTLPYLLKEQFDLQWVYNILDGKSEQDRIIYDNNCDEHGFVLLPDLKWDGVTLETLYCLVIVRQRGIKSLRDLDGSHIPLLKKIRQEGKREIYKKYKLKGNQLRIYLHYQPSFYHLHIHFTYLKHEAPGINAEKSHLLDTVIQNLQMMPDYYKKASIPFTIREMDKLCNIYQKIAYVTKVKPINDVNTELIVK